MYLTLILLPITGSILSGIFGKLFGSLGTVKISIFTIILSLSISILNLIETIFFKSFTNIDLTYWIDSEFLNIKWGFYFDNFTIIMCFIVLFVSLMVHFYSCEYMYYDPFLTKFMSYLSLFTFFMLILITSSNIIQLFIGWEGVGLCSYLLINFWFIRIQANKAAIKAMIINRIGDFGLLIGIIIIFLYFKTLEYSTLNLLIILITQKKINFNLNILDVISFFLFIGATGKSAQLTLHTWLPDAMEGPTPVSALIHAATMVTAGVFLIFKTATFFESSKYFLKLVIIIGTLTALIASLIGLFQNDLKKIVAYSTCSQLGYMIFACGLGDYYIAFFHLSNHAFFKALLFLSSGSIIHSINEEQDIRKMGGLKKNLNLTYITTVIGSLALTGFPFLTGFYSKDLILESAISKFNYYSLFCYIIGTFGAFLTAFYSYRSIYLTFLIKPNGFKNIINYSIDSGFIIKFTLIILSIPSIFIGYVSKDILTGFGNNSFTTLTLKIKNYNIFNLEFINLFFKLLPNLFSLLGILMVFILYQNYIKFSYNLKLLPLFYKTYNFLNRKWFFDKIYNELIAQFFFKYSYNTSYKFIDRGLLEILGPLEFSKNLINFNIIFKLIKTNLLYNLLLTLFFNLLIIIIFINYITFFSYSLIILNILILIFKW